MEQLRIAAVLWIVWAGCATRSEEVVAPEPLARSMAIEGRIGLVRPPRLAEGEPCRGVLTQVRPDPDSGELPYWGCFANGAIDQAYTPGVVQSSVVEAPRPPLSTVTFDSVQLDAIGSTDREELERFDADAEAVDGPSGRNAE